MKLNKIMYSLLFILIIGSITYGVEFDLKSKAAILMDAKTGRIFYEKNIKERLPIASISKVMTSLLVIEAIESGKIKFEDEVVVSKFAASMGGSQIWLKPKEIMTVRELLKAVLVVSANDACVALAEHISGSEQVFVTKMNKKAEELGLKNTKFYNTNGLPEKNNNYSSAEDIAIVSRELIKSHPIILEDSSIWTSSLRNGKSFLRNTNELVRTNKYVDGLKTGFTSAAGFCITATGKKDGKRFIAVVLNAPSSDIRFTEIEKLLNYAYSNIKYLEVVQKNNNIGKIEVMKGKGKYLPVVTSSDLTLSVTYEEEKEIKIKKTINKKIIAPVKKGEKIGEITLMKNNQKLGVVDLIAKEDMQKANILVLFFRGIKNIISNIFHMIF